MIRLIRVVRFGLFFIWELFLANFRVAHDVVTPRLHAHPAVIELPLDARTDLEITLLANLISLTPGTLSLDVSPDRRTLLVHVLFGEDPERTLDELKTTIERPLLEVLR